METDDDLPEEPVIDDAIEELEELADLVDSGDERRKVRRAMRVLERTRQPGLFGDLRDSFGLRDAGEAFVGAFVFGVPMLVEGGTQEVGEFLADHLAYYGLTAVLGLGLLLGILSAVEFEQVEEDLLFGVVPRRLIGILLISGGTSLALMTAWGRVDWGAPRVATAQVVVTAVVMAIGASLGDILPES